MNNYSKQREIVLEVLKELYHPSAEEIYNKVHQVDATISKSTVYRNINVLLKNQVIKKIKAITGPDKFDYIRKEHYHVICKKCGRIFDFIYPFKEQELTEIIENQTGVKINIDSITFNGLCKKCISKENKEELKNGKL